MKEFISKIKSNVYDPAYYRELLEKPLGYSFRYFFTFVFYIALILTVIFSFMSVPAARFFFNGVLQKAADIYPAELEIKIDRGVVTTNMPEPYFIKIPDDKKNSINQNGAGFENFLVIDTQTPFSLEEFKSYKTMVLLTRDTAVYYKGDRTTEIQTLEAFPDLTINKEFVSGWLNKIKPLDKFIPAFVVLGTFTGIFFSNAIDLLFLLLASLLVRWLFWYWGMTHGYKKAYQVGLHALTLPTLIYYVFFFVPVLHSGLFFWLLFLLAVIINLRPNASTGSSPTTLQA